jgi:hypothetical protein
VRVISCVYERFIGVAVRCCFKQDTRRGTGHKGNTKTKGQSHTIITKASHTIITKASHTIIAKASHTIVTKASHTRIPNCTIPLSSCLLVILISSRTASSLGGSIAGRATCNATRTTTAIGRSERKVNELLRVETDNEAGHINNLLADANVALANQNTGMVNRLGKTELEDLCLQTTLHKVLSLQAQDVIELLLLLVEDTDADETADKGVTLEKTTRVALRKRQKLTGSLADLGKGEGDTVDFGLVTETVLTGELQLMVKTSLDKGTARDLVGLGV